jgi:hypothetical protein
MARKALDSLRMWLARVIAGPLIRREIQQAFTDGCESGRRTYAQCDEFEPRVMSEEQALAPTERIARHGGIPVNYMVNTDHLRGATTAAEVATAEEESWRRLERAIEDREARAAGGK